jgi:hypothetical protein
MHQKENNRRGIFRKNIKSKRNYIILKNAREEKKNKKALKKDEIKKGMQQLKESRKNVEEKKFGDLKIQSDQYHPMKSRVK